MGGWPSVAVAYFMPQHNIRVMPGGADHVVGRHEDRAAKLVSIGAGQTGIHAVAGYSRADQSRHQGLTGRPIKPPGLALSPSLTSVISPTRLLPNPQNAPKSFRHRHMPPSPRSSGGSANDEINRDYD